MASGRMAHLGLSNSLLFEGSDFSDHEGVNSLLADPGNFPLVLYPDPEALPVQEALAGLPEGKQPVIFLFDGTWRSAPQMRRLSRNLLGLPTVKLQPARPSGFLEVRPQPRAECLSTLEAIHAVLDRLWVQEPAAGRPHDNLLVVFERMVAIQMSYLARADHGR